MDDIELRDTDFGGSLESNNLLGNSSWLSKKSKLVTAIEKMFGEKDYYCNTRSIGFLSNDILLLEPECVNVRFIKWLMDKKGFKIKNTLSQSGFLVNYDFSYDAGNVWNMVRTFKTTDTLQNSENRQLLNMQMHIKVVEGLVTCA